jgi:hypothetical protein
MNYYLPFKHNVTKLLATSNRNYTLEKVSVIGFPITLTYGSINFFFARTCSVVTFPVP